MNTVGILVIGNEILDGVTLDTNTQWMIKQLKPLNYHVVETLTVRDDLGEIGRALNRMLEDSLGWREEAHQSREAALALDSEPPGAQA